MMNKMNRTNKELEMMELNENELDQVVGGGTTASKVYLGTCAAVIGAFFFQLPGAILGAIWGSDDTPLFPSEGNTNTNLKR